VMHIISVDEVLATPWKNGAGQARDLLAWPEADDWAVRVSVAELTEDAAFSAYPGVDRWFGLLQGPGVELQWRKAVRRMDVGHTLLHFDGGLPPQATLMGGPSRALNVMARRGAARVKVQPADDGSDPPQGYDYMALFALEPLVLQDILPLRMPAMSLAWGPRRASTVEMDPGAHAWWIAFDNRPAE
jgi:uncharacterized protein